MQRRLSNSRTNPEFTTSLSDLTQSTHTVTSTLMTKLQEKHAEYEHLRQVRDMSSQLVVYFDELARSTEVLVNGVEAVSNVLGNWNNVFRVMSMTDQSPLEELPANEQGTTDTSFAEANIPPVFVKFPTGGDL